MLVGCRTLGFSTVKAVWVVFAKMCILHPAEWANLRKYALQTYPGADCENMRAAKITYYPRMPVLKPPVDLVPTNIVNLVSPVPPARSTLTADRPGGLRVQQRVPRLFRGCQANAGRLPQAGGHEAG